LVRQFADTSGFSLLVINFERNPEFREVFVEKDLAQIQTVLRLLSGQKIVPALQPAKPIESMGFTHICQKVGLAGAARRWYIPLGNDGYPGRAQEFH
jgi:hypothetical protein